MPPSAIYEEKERRVGPSCETRAVRASTAPSLTVSLCEEYQNRRRQQRLNLYPTLSTSGYGFKDISAVVLYKYDLLFLACQEGNSRPFFIHMKLICQPVPFPAIDPSVVVL